MEKIKILITGFLIISLFSSYNYIYAETASELQNQKKDIDEQIEQTSTEIAGVKEKMTEALNKINELNLSISTYETEINQLEIQIDSLNNQILEKEANILEQEEKYAIQKELLEKRLVALYESGTTTYLDMLLSSESLSDFISKYYLISQLADANEELLNKILNTKNHIETEKIKLETVKENLEISKLEVFNKQNALVLSVDKKQSLVSILTNEEAALEQQLEEFENDKKEIQNKLFKIAEQEKYNFSNKELHLTPSTYGYIFPASGCSKSNINNLSYPSYKGHTGIDININVVGKNVVAVKDGTVVISTAAKNANGSYRSYGEYIVINHHDGTMTLYAHMLEDSRKVREGQKVTQGQVIGRIGNTGNSTGTHLHFEVLINGRPVNPIPYLP